MLVTDKRYLLFGVMPPTMQFPGGIMLDQLCRLLPRGSIFCFAAKDPNLHVEISPDLSWVPCKTVNRPRELIAVRRFIRRIFPRLWAERLAFALEQVKNVLIDRMVVARAVRFGQRHGVHCVWATLQGKTTIVAAPRIAQRLGIPLITHIWDDPVWYLEEVGFDQRSAAQLLQDYDRAIQSSAMCATASWQMAEDYRQKYGVKCVAFLGSLDQTLARAPATAPHNDAELIIAVAGKIYAREAWDALLDALALLEWKIDKRRVKIYLIGKFDDLRLPPGANVELFGYQPLNTTLEILSQSDITYCPYYFSKNFEPVAKTSFPSKLTAYLAAGRPVLFHGPRYSSPAKFIEENQAGLCCHSLEPAEIAEHLRRLATDRKLYATLARNGREAFDKYLTLDRLHEYFKEFLSAPFAR